MDSNVYNTISLQRPLAIIIMMLFLLTIYYSSNQNGCRQFTTPALNRWWTFLFMQSLQTTTDTLNKSEQPAKSSQVILNSANSVYSAVHGLAQVHDSSNHYKRKLLMFLVLIHSIFLLPSFLLLGFSRSRHFKLFGCGSRWAWWLSSACMQWTVARD